MKKVVFLLAVAFMSAPAFGHSSTNAQAFEEAPTDCHAYACQVAEQGASLGGDVNDIYELAYEVCNG